MQTQEKNQNPLDEELKEEDKDIDYTDEEKKYSSYLQQRLENGRNIRNQNHDEFDGMSYTMYYQSNLQGANSFIAPKKNKDEVNFTTGTTRQALLAYVSKMNTLNLTPEVRAFNKENSEHIHVAHAQEDALFQSCELDRDEEKRLGRQYELYAQGTVFVQDAWVERWQERKTGLDPKKWDGTIKDNAWTSKLEKVYEGPCRETLTGLNVFLGKITEFEMEKQPYVYTVDYKDYNDAKQIYGKWERWKYVTKKVRYWSNDIPQTLYNNNWRLENTQDNVVEEIIYRDKWANEYMIILNGVMMMPIGFPFPWSHGEYDIVKQIYELIANNFAYGGSLIKRLKVSQQLETEFWRLAILKSHKSFQPARGNMSGQVLGSRIFMPGKITPGITAEMVPVLDPNGSQGVTQPEIEMMNKLAQNLKDNSLPDLNQSPEATGDATATQIMQLKRQADIMAGIALFSAGMLEKKLAKLRGDILLENWYEPTETVADTTKMDFVKLFRNTSRNVAIPGAGRGRRLTKITQDIPNSGDIYNEEENMSKSEGQPVRIIYLNNEELKQANYTFYYSVVPKEKETSEMSRIMFGNMMEQALADFQNDLNLSYFEEKFAEAWNLNPDKAFINKSNQMMSVGPTPPGQMPNPNGAPPQQTVQPNLHKAMQTQNNQPMKV